MTELTNTMTKQELIATQNVNNMESGSLISRVEQNEQDISQLVSLIYPVGAIYMSVNATSPAELFGGTWEEFGKGRTVVGVDTTQAEFNTVEKTGGAKTHTLTIPELASHTHVISRYWSNTAPGDSAFYGSNASGAGGVNNYGIGEAGGNQPHNNLQPYITCYMWKRVA